MKLLEISQKLANEVLRRRVEQFKQANRKRLSPRDAKRLLNKKVSTFTTHTRWGLHKTGAPRSLRGSDPRFNKTSEGITGKIRKGVKGHLPALAGAAALAGGGYLAYKYLTKKKNSNKTKESSTFRESTDQAFMNLRERAQI